MGILNVARLVAVCFIHFLGSGGRRLRGLAIAVSSFLQQIFIGSVIIAAVLVDAMLKSQRK